MAFSWPASLKPSEVAFWLENTSRGGGVAINGTEQRIFSPDQRWRAAIVVPISTREQILVFRALMARADGSAGSIDLPAFEGRRANWPRNDFNRLDPGATRRRNLDGTIYEDPRIPAESEIHAELAGAAAARATEIAIEVTQGEPLDYGQYVSIDGRLYILQWLVSTVGAVQTFQIKPPLRSAQADGAAVECAIPTCMMRLAADDMTRMDLTMLQFSELSLEFVEWF